MVVLLEGGSTRCFASPPRAPDLILDHSRSPLTIFCLAINAYTYRIAYPLWRDATPAGFPRIQSAYLRLLTTVIILPHIAMFFSTVAVAFRPAPWLPRPGTIAVFALGSLVILLSAFLVGPIHDRFTRNAALDHAGIERLIQLSAFRTDVMSAATAILLANLIKVVA